MTEYSPLLVKLEYKEAGEVLPPLLPISLGIRVCIRMLVQMTVCAGSAARAPSHNQLLWYAASAEGGFARDGFMGDARGENGEFDVADDWDPVPGDG